MGGHTSRASGRRDFERRRVRAARFPGIFAGAETAPHRCGRRASRNQQVDRRMNHAFFVTERQSAAYRRLSAARPGAKAAPEAGVQRHRRGRRAQLALDAVLGEMARHQRAAADPRDARRRHERRADRGSISPNAARGVSASACRSRSRPERIRRAAASRCAAAPRCTRISARVCRCSKASHHFPYSARFVRGVNVMRGRDDSCLSSRFGASASHRPRAAERSTPIDVPAIHHPDQETPDWWFRAGAAAAHANATRRRRTRRTSSCSSATA